MFKISEDMIDLNVGGFTFSESEELEKAEEKLYLLLGENRMTIEEKDKFDEILLAIKNECITNGFLRGFSVGYELSKEIEDIKK